jgi:hypothetical protein
MRVPCPGSWETMKGFLLLTDLPDPTLLSLKRSRASDVSWGNTADWSARTAPARRAAEERFLKLAGGDVKRAEKLREAHYKNMRLKSLATRRAKAAAAAEAEGVGE